MQRTLNKTIILVLSLFLIVSISFATEKISIEKAKKIMSYSLINVVEKKVEQPLIVKVVNENSDAVKGIPVIFDVVSFPSSSKGAKK